MMIVGLSRRAGGSLKPALRGARGEWFAMAVFGTLIAAAVWLSSPGSFVPDIKPEVYLAPWRSAVDYLAAWQEDPSLGSASFDVGLAPVAFVVTGLDALGATPDVAVRLLHVALLVVGALGARQFVRYLSNDRATSVGRVVAAIAYVANPYVVVAGSTLPILLPWAMLPWFGLAVLAGLRHERAWRYPVLAGLAFAAMTGINAGVVPLMQLLVLPALVAAARTEQVPWRHIVSTLGRTAVVVIALSAYWWVPSLGAVDAGAAVLANSESPAAIAAPSSAAEVLRGLGLWPMYGGDGGDPWQPGFSGYITAPWLVVLTGLLPALVLASLALMRRRTAVTALLLIVPAALIMVGQHPPEHPSPLGRTLGWLFEHVPVVGAFRTTNKVGAVLVLGVTLALATAATYLVRRTSARWPVVAGLGVFALVTTAAVHPALAGRLFTVEYNVPDYWRAAAADLDNADDGSRVWFLPGQSQADYAWTEPIPDDLSKALLDRPSVIRYTLPAASPHAANMLLAADTTLQEQTAPPGALRTYARYLGVGQLLVRRDQRWLPWQGASPADVDAQVRGSDGIRPGAMYGDVGENTSDTLTPLQVFDIVQGGRLVSAAPAPDRVLIAGDGFAVAPAAQAGLLDGSVPFRYLADLDTQGMEAALEGGSRLVMTDTNRRQSWRQDRLTSAHGPLLPGDESPSRSFALGGPDDQTVLRTEGAHVSASESGSASGPLPASAPELALDGDVETAWQFGDFGRGLGALLEIELTEMRAVEEIGVHITRLGPREIAWVRIMAGERGQLVEVGSDGVARANFGGVVTDRLAVSIIDTRGDDGTNLLGVSEVELAGVGTRRVARLPLTLTRLAEGLDDEGRAALAATPLDILLSRQVGVHGAADDDERTLDRDMVLPDDRNLVLEGHGTLRGPSGGHALDVLLGGNAEVVANASSTAFDLLTVRGSQAVDRNDDTAWLPGAPVIGSSLSIAGPDQPLDEIVVSQRATGDGTHISEVEIVVDGGSVGRHRLSAETTTIPLDVPAASELTLTVTQLSDPTTQELVGISELVAGEWSLEVDPLHEAVGRCVRVGTLDGAPLEAAIAEPIGDDGTFTLAGCGDGPLRLGAGEHRLRTAGPWLMDNMYLLDAGDVPVRTDAVPEVQLINSSPRSRTVEVDGADGPFVLILAEAAGQAWTATVDGVEVKPASVVNGYAAAWPMDFSGDAVVELHYGPQRRADLALGASLVALVACLVVMVRGMSPGQRASPRGPDTAAEGRSSEPKTAGTRLFWSALVATAAWFVGGPWLLGVAVVVLAVDALVPLARRPLVLAGAAFVAAAPVAYLLANRGDLTTVTPLLVTDAPAGHMLALSGLLLVVVAHLPSARMESRSPAERSEQP